MLKQCTKCKRRLPTGMFTSDKAKSDGLYPSCKECQIAWRKKVGLTRSVEVLSKEYKRCTKCKKALLKSEFIKDSSKRDGLYSSCRDCYRKRLGIKKREKRGIDSGGYKFGKKKRLHQEIAESVYRKLMDGEVVHHINGDKADNRPANLQIMSHSEHSRLHLKERNEKNKTI